MDKKASTSASQPTASDEDDDFLPEQEALDRRIPYEQLMIQNNDFLDLEKK